MNTVDEAGRDTAPEGRARNAAASRQSLLDAAQALFSLKGFEATTLREIGERAGVDAALIARYFGSKTDLYIAAVAAETSDEGRPRLSDRLEDLADALLVRMDRHGLGPIVQSVIRADTSDEIRAAARAHLARRLVAPLQAQMESHGVDSAQLGAEICASALLGVCLGRSLGWFDELSTVPRRQLVELISETLTPG
jgi:AcrR family transcriptional regulator